MDIIIGWIVCSVILVPLAMFAWHLIELGMAKKKAEHPDRDEQK